MNSTKITKKTNEAGDPIEINVSDTNGNNILLKILLEKSINKYYITGDIGVVYFWFDSIAELISWINKYPKKFFAKINLINKLDKLYRAMVRLEMKNRKDDEVVTTCLKLLKDINTIRNRVMNNNSGLTKDEINYFNNMIQKHKIKIDRI